MKGAHDGSTRGERLSLALFPVLLAVLSEILVQLTGWPRLYVLVTVFCSGYAALTVVRWSHRREAVRRGAAALASPSSPTPADASGH